MFKELVLDNYKLFEIEKIGDTRYRIIDTLINIEPLSFPEEKTGIVILSGDPEKNNAWMIRFSDGYVIVLNKKPRYTGASWMFAKDHNTRFDWDITFPKGDLYFDDLEIEVCYGCILKFI